MKGEFAKSAVAIGWSASDTRSFLHHVRLAGEVQVHLNGRGAVHHVEAKLAHLRHVGRHDVVAAFRHARRLIQRPQRRKAQGEERDTQRIRNLAHLTQMAAYLLAGLEDRFQRRARQFELAARLQRDRAAEIVRRFLQRDDLVAVVNGPPSEALPHAVEQCRNARRPFVRDRPQAVAIEGDLLVLGADPPFGFRLRALLDMRHELVAALDDRRFRFVAAG